MKEDEEEEDCYLVEGEFAFTSYMPAKLMAGMHFLTQITVGLLEPEWLFFTLEEVPEDEEMYMTLYGAPVLVYIIVPGDEGEVLATPKEVGLFNDGEDVLPLSDKVMNEIINKDEGYMDVECDEEGNPYLFEGKVIISYLSESEEEEENP